LYIIKAHATVQATVFKRLFRI